VFQRIKRGGIGVAALVIAAAGYTARHFQEWALSDNIQVGTRRFDLYQLNLDPKKIYDIQSQRCGYDPENGIWRVLEGYKFEGDRITYGATCNINIELKSTPEVAPQVSPSRR